VEKLNCSFTCLLVTFFGGNVCNFFNGHKLSTKFAFFDTPIELFFQALLSLFVTLESKELKINFSEKEKTPFMNVGAVLIVFVTIQGRIIKLLKSLHPRVQGYFHTAYFIA
jgi:hypothetical protein